MRFLNSVLTQPQVTVHPPQTGWSFETVPYKERFPYGSSLRDNIPLPEFIYPDWSDGHQASFETQSFASVYTATHSHSHSQEGHRHIPVRASYQAQNIRGVARAVAPATGYASAIDTSDSAVDDNSVSSFTAHESVFQLSCPPGASAPIDADPERHHAFDIPSQAVRPCPYPVQEHSHHCSDHKEHLRYDYRSNLRESHNRNLSSTVIERGNSHHIPSLTNSRQSERPLSPDKARYCSSSCVSFEGLMMFSERLVCKTCNTPFTGSYRRRNFTRHKQTAHGDGAIPLYACAVPGCDRAYKRGDALRVHEGRIHPTLFAPRQSRSKRPEEQG